MAEEIVERYADEVHQQVDSLVEKCLISDDDILSVEARSPPASARHDPSPAPVLARMDARIVLIPNP